MFLVDLRGASLNTSDETGANPNSSGPVSEKKAKIRGRLRARLDSRKRCGKSTPVRDTTSSNDEDRLAGQRALLVLANVDACWDQHGERNLASVSASLESNLRSFSR